MPTPLLIFCGPPGAGKGTQAKLVLEQLSEQQSAAGAHLSSGDILREELANGTERAKIFTNYVNSGKLVPDEIVAEMVFEKLRSLTNSDTATVVLDGFPRKVSQAKMLGKFADENGFALRAVLFFDVTLERLTERILGRASESNGVGNRSDDTVDTIKTRYREYLTHTLPIVEYYRESDLLVEIDANGSVAEIAEQVMSVVAQTEAFAG